MLRYLLIKITKILDEVNRVFEQTRFEQVILLSRSSYHFAFAKFKIDCIEAETRAVRPNQSKRRCCLPDQSQRRNIFSTNEAKKLKVLFPRTPPVTSLLSKAPNKMTCPLEI